MDRRQFIHSAIGLGTASLALNASLTGTTQAETFPTFQPNPQQEKPHMTTDQPVLIAADPFAKTLKDAIIPHLKEQGYHH